MKEINNHAKIWKYLDFTKFISLLETGSLYFPRSDRLADPHEGIYTKFSRNCRPIPFLGGGNGSNAPAAFDQQKIRPEVFLNCWHLNEYESAAMWDLYLKSNEGLAIQSTFKKLTNCLGEQKRHDVRIGRVKYLDCQATGLTSDDIPRLFLQKRKSFAHENEVRALIRDEASREKNGIFLPIDVFRLIERIYVAPTAEDWIRDLVETLVRKYGLTTPVIKSSLFDDPVF